jgi:hypothetical protein
MNYVEGRFVYGDDVYIDDHCLVAEAFIPNPNNFPIVRHLYDYPDQNSADDLAWAPSETIYKTQ